MLAGLGQAFMFLKLRYVKLAYISFYLIKGVWECKEGETAIYYRNWADGKPKTSDVNKYDCVKYRIKSSNNGWNDVGCESAQELAVCKKPAPSLHFLHV